MSDIREAAVVLSKARRLAVLTGAGVSKESGISTFRDAQSGLWEKYDPSELATREAFQANPDRVWAWYMFRAGLAAGASPNAGHRALVRMESLIEDVVIVTQNVDGLHARAGSRQVLELHGRLDRYKCFAGCRGEPTQIDLVTIPHDREHAPLCPHCHSRVRPDVVWFGERLAVQTIDAAHHAAATCDVMLVVGTSGVVQPAASLPLEAKNHSALLIDVNPEQDVLAGHADLFLQGPAGKVLPDLAQRLENESHRR